MTSSSPERDTARDRGRRLPSVPAAKQPASTRTFAVATGAVLLAAAFALPGIPRSAAAQPADPPVELEFTATGGLLAPATDLTDPIVTAPPSADPSTRALELSGAFAFGGGVGVKLPGGLTAEGHLLFSPGVDLQTADDGTVLSDADHLALTGHLLWRLPLPLVQPFVGAGGGWKRVSFDDPSVLGTEDESDLTGTLLAGAYVDLVPGLTIRAEARGYLSSFEDPRVDDSELQNDMAFLAGLVWSVP